ncbi:Histone-lysine N-methyltransferase ASHR1 [Dichanthelium oligosanthes]|uniref:Histone-lysine N-methyltransferase ASHR1 n=1 Tax=Dichanthelium oligosanthes TaxID=888268 RepID=A0A1E5UNN9_9POAL|nr:Histone-lysine N-methyltransferase ASHR1 [Dichanthelium oligosanthes]
MASWAEQLQLELAGCGLAVASIPRKGRGLVASRTFFPGEVIISQEPYVSTPNKSLVGSSCDHCFASRNLRKCSVCRVTWYCSSDCQKNEWKLHQHECRVMAALTEDRKKMLTPTIRLMVRLVLKRKLQNEKVIPSSGIDNYCLVDALESHILEVDENQLVLYAQMANLVNLILPSLELDLKEIAHTFSKFACNAHTICDPELRPLGTGLYPVISIINHRCCVPNAVLIFDGRTACVRALQPIGKDEEVSISYIETAAVTKKRQNDLKQYFFTCTCPRCVKDSKEDALLESYRCKNQACGGFLLPDSGEKAYTCQKCSISRDEEEVKKMTREILLLSDKASSFLSSGSILIYMELQGWQTALMYCRLTIPVYERVYPPFHPMIGLQFYTCGKLEWLLGCAEDALRSLTRAADILRITHGTNSQFMKELFGKLEEARAEVSFRLSSGHGHDEQIS